LRADQHCKPSQCQNNADELLSYTKERYEQILDNSMTYMSILRYTFSALLSGPCLDFNTCVESITGDVDSGIGTPASITFERLDIVSCKKYLSMTTTNDHFAIDPKDDQLMTLITKL
jgi:hypothetical protein